jgi:hypothetical protein
VQVALLLESRIRFLGFSGHRGLCSRSSSQPNFFLQNGHGRRTFGGPVGVRSRLYILPTDERRNCVGSGRWQWGHLNRISRMLEAISILSYTRGQLHRASVFVDRTMAQVDGDADT